jgi:hypothetical protein
VFGPPRCGPRSPSTGNSSCCTGRLDETFWNGSGRRAGAPGSLTGSPGTLGAKFPGVEGLSPRSLKYMRAFADAWPEKECVQQAIAQLSWGHQTRLPDRIKDRPTREWYLTAAVENGWSQNVLVHHISARLHERRSSTRRRSPAAGATRIAGVRAGGRFGSGGWEARFAVPDPEGALRPMCGWCGRRPGSRGTAWMSGGGGPRFRRGGAAPGGAARGAALSVAGRGGCENRSPQRGRNGSGAPAVPAVHGAVRPVHTGRAVHRVCLTMRRSACFLIQKSN